MQARGEIRRGGILAWLTIDPFSRSSSIKGYVDTDSAPYGTHLLSPVTQECLKLLCCTSKRAQSHTALTYSRFKYYQQYIGIDNKITKKVRHFELLTIKNQNGLAKDRPYDSNPSHDLTDNSRCWSWRYSKSDTIGGSWGACGQNTQISNFDLYETLFLQLSRNIQYCANLWKLFGGPA